MKENTSHGFAARAIRMFRQAAAFPATGIKAVDQALKAIEQYCLYGGAKKRMARPEKAGCLLWGKSPEVLLAKRKRRKCNCMVAGSVRPKRKGKREKTERQCPTSLKAAWMPSGERNSVYKRESRTMGSAYKWKNGQAYKDGIKGYGRRNGLCGIIHPIHLWLKGNLNHKSPIP